MTITAVLRFDKIPIKTMQVEDNQIVVKLHAIDWRNKPDVEKVPSIKRLPPIYGLMFECSGEHADFYKYGAQAYYYDFAGVTQVK